MTTPEQTDLYCEEEKWWDVEDEEGDADDGGEAMILNEQDLFWEEDELFSLFSKEKEAQILARSDLERDPFLSAARTQAVGWILRVNACYRFNSLTVILAVDYLDRFLASLDFQKDGNSRPWVIQLATVSCLSLAAKMEEIQVPLLLDFQVVESKYVFEAKTIQKMELLILSTLNWRMNPVTPLSFLDHILRRLGLKHHLHWEFLAKCESLLLSVVADSKVVRYLPSVLACATMLHAINKVDPCNAADYQSQLLGVLKISKENVDDCYELIAGIHKDGCNNKRRYEEDDDHGGAGVPCSPSGVTEACFSSDSSNDSWVTFNSSVSSPEVVIKRRRIQEQRMRLPSPAAALSRVLAEMIGSPR